MSRKTIDQRRAEHAWVTVKKAKDLQGEEQKKFVTQVKKLPARIVTSGLGQALAFLKAKGHAKLLLEELSDWVLYKHQKPEGNLPSKANDNLLIDRIIKSDSYFLRRATDEVLSYVMWVGRFTEAEGLKGEEDKNEPDDPPSRNS